MATRRSTSRILRSKSSKRTALTVTYWSSSVEWWGNHTTTAGPDVTSHCAIQLPALRLLKDSYEGNLIYRVAARLSGRMKASDGRGGRKLQATSGQAIR